MMEPLFTDEDPAQSTLVVRGAAHRKSNGVHYTPPELAQFVARRVASRLPATPARVLDPACGDGELLEAIGGEAKRRGLPAPYLVGVDQDEEALQQASERLSGVFSEDVDLRCADFLASISEHSDVAGRGVYDAIVSNPPYVRTQVLGAGRAQELARQFGLRGRVDLYHAFVAAMTLTLVDNGVIGLLCSNRFLATRTGQSLRALLLRGYDIEEIWDLGDTKLFSAAVLPAVVVARRTSHPDRGESLFVRVYEHADASEPSTQVRALLPALESGAEGIVGIAGQAFEVERGSLADPTVERPWRVASARGVRWMHAIRKRSSSRFGDLGPIRVGIKSTADTVFIRQSFEDLPEAVRPEPELVFPLLTHRVAARWTAKNAVPKEQRYVLYPHVLKDGRRAVVDLEEFPRAAAYLEQHRERLESRTYVLKAGRQWFEIWVPQQPDGWHGPKIVWPDISDRPKFFLDPTDAIVNGDCYWLSCPDLSTETVLMVLAIANSSFALGYYDLCCGNRLYAGRRRFITQYLEDLPLPDVSGADLASVVSQVTELRGLAADGNAEILDQAERELDDVVWGLFGLEEVSR